VSGAPGARLRRLLEAGVVEAPGAYDAVSAQLVVAAGFDAVYLSGAVTSAVLLGEPDLGYTGRAEMLDLAGRITAAVDLPLVADADTGYGNALHAAATVRAYERAGLAGLHLEDQVAPKRCGHMSGKVLESVEEMTAKVRAAVEARGDLVVIARTDARSVEGLEAAIDRAGRYLDAGADLAFIEGAAQPEELERVHAALPTARLVLNRSEAGGPWPALSADELDSVGVRLVLYPVATLLAAAGAVRARLAGLRTPAGGMTASKALAWDELTDLLGLPDALAAEGRYATEG
jgi:2,3-dimethylmalate lyase